MSYSFSCKLLVIATLFSPLPSFAQSGGGGSGGSISRMRGFSLASSCRRCAARISSRAASQSTEIS
jgi:hypothetical protein